MTTPDERTRAIVDTRRLLRELTSAEATPAVPDYIRDQARALLRHYPGNSELRLASMALLHLFVAASSLADVGGAACGAELLASEPLGEALLSMPEGPDLDLPERT